MTQAPRHPTRGDYEAMRSFCCIFLTISEQELSAKLIGTNHKIEADRSGSLRINPYGTIDTLKLGEFKFQSSSAYTSTGVLLDYSENKDELLEKAKLQLEAMRVTYMARLSDHRNKLAALEIVTVL